MKKFERTQWPVGHGGFHTGKLEQDGDNFSFFYDCGSKTAEKSASKKLMHQKLADIEFDFGVISHFDSDHFSEVQNATVETLFLPYATRSDILLNILVESQHSTKSLHVTATAMYTRLNVLRQRSRIVMVKHGSLDDVDPPLPGDNRQAPTRILDQVPMVRSGMFDVISDETVLHEQDRSRNPVLDFKFFNYKWEQISTEFAGALHVHLGSLRDETDQRYRSVQAFLQSIEDHPGIIARKNGKVLQTIYKELLAPHGISEITPSNLSSLCLFSRVSERVRSKSVFRTVKARHLQHRDSNNWREGKSGWMLTGDLELASPVWNQFYDHYFIECDECLVFNVPHHSSSKSVTSETLHALTGECVYLANVKSGDKKHPSDTLRMLFQAFHCEDQLLCVDEDPASIFSLSTRHV